MDIEKINKKKASLSIVKYMLKQKGEASIIAYGDSMYPAILNNTMIKIMKQEYYAIGDVIAFYYENEGLLVHRILKKNEYVYYCKGDNSYRLEIVYKDNALGKIINLPNVNDEFIVMSLKINLLAHKLHYDLEKLKKDSLYIEYKTKYLT
jgi:hypothetical protein